MNIENKKGISPTHRLKMKTQLYNGNDDKTIPFGNGTIELDSATNISKQKSILSQRHHFVKML